MSGFFTSDATYDRPIRLGEQVETVTLRPLMAGDRADIQDAVRVTMDDDEGEGGSAELRMGRMQLLTVAAAVVAWTLDLTPTLSSVRALNPTVFDQIYAEISWGTVPDEPTKEEAAGSPLPGSNASSDKHAPVGGASSSS